MTSNSSPTPESPSDLDVSTLREEQGHRSQTVGVVGAKTVNLFEQVPTGPKASYSTSTAFNT